MSDVALYRRLLRQARPYWLWLLGLFATGLLASPIALLTPVPLKIVVDSVLGSKPLPTYLDTLLPPALRAPGALLILAIGLLVIVAALGQVQGLANKFLQTSVGERLVLGFRAQLVRQAQRLSLSYHDARGTADSVYRVQQDAAVLDRILVEGVIPFVTAGITLALMITVTARLDWQLALVALTVSPPLFLLSRVYRPRMRRQSRDVKKLESQALAVVQETLGALRVVKAFGQEQRETERFFRRSSEGMAARIRLALLEGRYGMLVGLTSALGTAAVLLIGVEHVRAGALTLGQLLMVLSYLTQLYEPLKTMSKKSASLQSYLASLERAFALLDERPEVPERPHPRPITRAAGAVAFRRVSFAYGLDQPVLHDISFEIQPGTRLGVVGATGAGKTTLISLLTRFYDPTAGEILLDGVDLRDYRLDDLRRQFAVVLQDPVLFSVSIAENIGYAAPGASRAQIVAAAQAANAHEFITRLPEGYETQVGERGVKLSGGQRQRVALARAFLKDSPVLILDEPTSAVDAETEAAILGAIRRLMRDRTVIVISHRPAMLEGCQAILTIEDGRVGEDTTPRPPAVSSARKPRPANGNIASHAAVQAWRRLHPTITPSGITPLRVRRKKNQVYRLDGAGRDGTAVIAKRCPKSVALLEHTVYAEILPGLPVPALRHYGFLEEPAGEYCWLFMEDATGADYSNLLPDHRAHAGRWLGSLHASIGDVAAAARLPDGGPGRYRDRLAAVRDMVRQHLDNPVLSTDDVAFLEGVETRCDDLAAHWDWLEDACRGAPRTLVHGDFNGKNIRVRSRDGASGVLVFDWEHVGWGVPAVDLAQPAVRSDRLAASPDLATYCATVQERWPDMTLDACKRLADCGTVFRTLAALYWDTQHLAYDWAHSYVDGMRMYVVELDGALERLDWGRPAVWSPPEVIGT